MHNLSRMVGIGLGLIGLVGCKDLTGSQGLPSGTTNPVFYNTKYGALSERNTALESFYLAFASDIVDAGLLSDELEDANVGSGIGALLSNGNTLADPLDERILSAGASTAGSQTYGYLQATRGYAAQAIGMLAKYDTAAADLTQAKILQAELHALTGYAELMLADLFCSGVPLSTLDFERDYTYHAGSSGDQVYRAAIAQFDTARVLADTSTQIANLARVGLGRAWLDLGQYAAAADDVQSVPDGFTYRLNVDVGDNILKHLFCTEIAGDGHVDCVATTSDSEGRNGLPFLSSGDPRSVSVTTFLKPQTDSLMRFPAKYQSQLNQNTITLTVASGVEARLIQAEQALHAGDPSWLTTLKTLHDTLPGVTPLTDPGTALSGTAVDSARIALLFRERAEWLYLTGSRQGDLRRLLRQYGTIWVDQRHVYPVGPYTAPGQGFYGTDVTVPIPSSELVNPLFHGCLNRDP